MILTMIFVAKLANGLLRGPPNVADVVLSSSDDTATVYVLSLPKFFMAVCYNSSHGIHSERPDFVRGAASE